MPFFSAYHGGRKRSASFGGYPRNPGAKAK
jgi:hypothetical protein